MQVSKQSLIDDNVALRTELDRVHEALAAVMAGDDQLVGQFTLDGQTVKARLIHADRAHGGLIMFSSQCGKSDRPSHRVHYLEAQEMELRHASTEYACQLRCLVGKAMTMRYRMTHPEQVSA